VLLHNTVVSPIRRSGLSVHCQLRITFLMLPTKIINLPLNLSKLLSWTTWAFPHVGYSKNGIFEDVIITPALQSNIRRKFIDILIRGILDYSCRKVWKYVLVCQRYADNIVDSFFRDTVSILFPTTILFVAFSRCFFRSFCHIVCQIWSNCDYWYWINTILFCHLSVSTIALYTLYADTVFCSCRPETVERAYSSFETNRHYESRKCIKMCLRAGLRSTPRCGSLQSL